MIKYNNLLPYYPQIHRGRQGKAVDNVGKVGGKPMDKHITWG